MACAMLMMHQSAETAVAMSAMLMTNRLNAPIAVATSANRALNDAVAVAVHVVAAVAVAALHAAVVVDAAVMSARPTMNHCAAAYAVAIKTTSSRRK